MVGCRHQAAPAQPPMPVFCSCGFDAALIVTCYYVFVRSRVSAKRNQQQNAKPVHASGLVVAKTPIWAISAPCALSCRSTPCPLNCLQLACSRYIR